MIELVVVVTVIGILIAMLSLGSSAVFDSVRRSQTLQTFRNVGFAIDTFAEIDPLKTYYNQYTRLGTSGKTFGAFPAYQVENAGVGGTVGGVFDTNAPLSLGQRLTRDLTGAPASAVPANGSNLWVQLHNPDANDDIRALGAYLRVFNEAGFNQIPEQDRIKLEPQNGTSTVDGNEYVRLPGDPSNATAFVAGGLNRNWVDLVGFRDAWGVPLDYMMYVKIEPAIRTRIDNGQPARFATVTDRRYVLRSHGVKKEIVQNRINQDQMSDRDAIYSSPLPLPYADVDPDTGNLSTGQIATNGLGSGWVRLRAANEGQFLDERGRTVQVDPAYGFLPTSEN